MIAIFRAHDVALANSFSSIASQQNRESKNWIFEEIEYFDSKYDELANTRSSIVNVEKHVFYRNVYTFVDRLKNLASLRDNDKLKIAISQCLRESVLIWHFMKLVKIEKALLREVLLKEWYKALTNKFKKRASQALLQL